MNLIGKLYGIEQQIKAKSADEKYVIRQQKSKIIIDELHQWLLQHQDKIPPEMALDKAILYALNQFEISGVSYTISINYVTNQSRSDCSV